MATPLPPAMIRCGLAFNVTNKWEVEQLFPHLQKIVAKYPENFNGLPVTEHTDLTAEVTETEEDA